MEADDWKFIKKDAPKGANISDDELLFLVEKGAKRQVIKNYSSCCMPMDHIFNYKRTLSRIHVCL